MHRTAESLTILVGDAKTPLTLAGNAVAAVQADAAGKAQDALQCLDEIGRGVARDGLLGVHLHDLIHLAEALQIASECVDVLIDCRPLDEVTVED